MRAEEAALPILASLLNQQEIKIISKYGTRRKRPGTGGRRQTAFQRLVKDLGEGVFTALLVGRRDRAEQRFAALKRNAADSQTTISTGCLFFYAVERSHDALDFCKRTVESMPNSHTAYSNYGYVLVDSAKFQDAYIQAQKAVSLLDFSKASETQQADIMWLAILADYFSGHKEEARSWIQTGLKADIPVAVRS